MKKWLLPLFLAAVTAIAAYVGALYAVPGFVMDRAWDRLATPRGANVMTHAPLATAESRTIVRPSPDLAYSICPLDVSESPVGISVAPIPGHYWSLTVFDEETNAVYVRSDRETGGEPINLIVAGPDSQVAEVDAEGVARLPGDKGVALVRILLDNRGEYEAVDALRRASDCGAL